VSPRSDARRPQPSSGDDGRRRASALRSPRQELADSTAHGEVYLRRLRRAQLQLSLLALVAFGAVFGVLPLALYLLPHLDRTTLLGIPVTIWVMLVPLSPLFIAIGWLYARRADALDAAFRDLVEK
jgi:putative solute:sodium symporter small subunit